MSHHLPLSNPNPNPNPNPHFHTHHPPPPPAADIPTALSTLRHLLRLAHTTLSLLPLNPHTPTPKPPSFSSDHQLRYPHNLQSSSNRNSFTVPDPGADLCFSLEEYGDFGPNFFYRDCPAAVSSADHDGSTHTFAVPGTLSTECANFSDGDNDNVIKTGSFLQNHNKSFLPSELWFIETEIERWHDFPVSYSYFVLRAIMSSLKIHESKFLKWVIANSPNYGITIDVHMRDHIVLLFKLCSKAIIREAVNWAELVLINNTNNLKPVAMNFDCPILVGAMKWLSFQFSILYNEVDAKRFAINMLKQWISISSKEMPLFVLQKFDASIYSNNTESESAELNKTTSVNGEENSITGKSVIGKIIFVSQVAAAVAALHERALLEEKLKVLSDTKPVPSHQRVAEHEFVSKRADEERKRRPDYRPLLEYDGIVWQRPSDQEGNTKKTREELLAEQRDYKRRRMSYRGKRLKRNATEVMRDIIDDCMDSIRQAGGIGSLTKVSDESEKSFSEPSPSDIASTDFGASKKNLSNSSTITSDQFNNYKERFDDKPLDDRKKRSRDSSRHYELRNDRRSTDRDRDSREYYSRSVERERSRGSRNRDDTEHRSNYKRERNSRDLEGKDRRKKHSERDHRADSVKSFVIEDRYDPYESQNTYEE